MPVKREYKGPPLDMTEQYITERSGSETIDGGTTDDDLFGQTTEWLPSGFDEDDFPPKQKEAIRDYLAHTDRDTVTMAEMAEGNDFSKETARRAIHKAFQDVRDLNDLTDSTKFAVLIWAHEGTTSMQSRLAEEYPVSSRALGEAKRIYPDLIEEKSPISEDDIDDAVEQYEKAHASSSTSKDNSEKSSAGRGRKLKSEKEYPDDFTDCYTWFIEAISDDPGKTKAEIGELMPEDAGFGAQNYYNVLRGHGDVIADRIKDKGTAESQDDLADPVADKIQLENGDSPKNDQEESMKADESDSEDSDIDKRLRAVESKVESVRHEVESVKESSSTESDSNVNRDLVEVIINSMSDEQLGKVIRGAMNDE